MKVKFDEGNNVSYMQDFHFVGGGVPSDVEFDVIPFTADRVKLVADGYGNLRGRYGNGALYISVEDLPTKHMNYQELRKKFEEEKQYPSWDCNAIVNQEYIEWLEGLLENYDLTPIFGIKQRQNTEL